MRVELPQTDAASSAANKSQHSFNGSIRHAFGEENISCK